jgi:hypothetical protein
MKRYDKFQIWLNLCKNFRAVNLTADKYLMDILAVRMD